MLVDLMQARLFNTFRSWHQIGIRYEIKFNLERCFCLGRALRIERCLRLPRQPTSFGARGIRSLAANGCLSSGLAMTHVPTSRYSH
jgi:hypothetical protein